MDNFTGNYQDRNKTKSEDASDVFALNEKFFLDGYEITASVKSSTPFAVDAKEFPNPYASCESQLKQEIKEEIRQATEQLLIEILFLDALCHYYEQLDNRFNGSAQPYLGDPYAAGRYQVYPYQVNGPKQHFWRALPHCAQQIILQAPRNLYKSFGNDVKAITRSSNNLVNEARHNLGRPVWALTKFAGLCQSGNLGCAATVGELLQDSGVKIAGSASVSGVVGQLANLGWHKIKISDKHQFHTGDIVFGLKGRHAHIGIISEANNDQVLVCDNSSSSGTLKERSIESGGSFTPGGRFAGSLYVMRKES